MKIKIKNLQKEIADEKQKYEYDQWYKGNLLDEIKELKQKCIELENKIKQNDEEYAANYLELAKNLNLKVRDDLLQ